MIDKPVILIKSLHPGDMQFIPSLNIKVNKKGPEFSFGLWPAPTAFTVKRSGLLRQIVPGTSIFLDGKYILIYIFLYLHPGK